MPNKPDEFNVHILLEGGHREEVRVSGPQEVTKLMNTIFVGGGGEDFVRLPKPLENEFLIVRPSRVCGVSVEAVFASSVGSY
ncbi:MAG: hypothetical protein AB4040_02775 [Synechococcus sp.]